MGTKWVEQTFTMNLVACSFSCHFIVIMLLNVISAMVILGTQGTVISNSCC